MKEWTIYSSFIKTTKRIKFWFKTPKDISLSSAWRSAWIKRVCRHDGASSESANTGAVRNLIHPKSMEVNSADAHRHWRHLVNSDGVFMSSCLLVCSPLSPAASYHCGTFRNNTPHEEFPMLFSYFVLQMEFPLFFYVMDYRSTGSANYKDNATDRRHHHYSTKQLDFSMLLYFAKLYRERI